MARAVNLEELELFQLRLNPYNDRHGPLRDETASIQWLLENRTNHMRALSQDLAKTKRLYEHPLVHPDGEKFIVFDGNRRVCCIKLLLNPELAPSDKWVEFFSGLTSSEVKDAFSRLECEVEANLEIIDETLLRRHTGSQDGVGQSPWDAEGKSYFLQRTGKGDVGLGESIEKVLKAEQLMPQDASLPWSNLERLFSSEPIRKRAGFSFSGGVLTFLTDKGHNLQTLQRIADDLTTKGDRRIVLEDIWNNAKKARYLDRLKSEGVLIDPTGARTAKSSASVDESVQQRAARPARGRTPKDKHLISSADENPFVQFPELERSERIWRELQFALEFDDHDNAIAVLMRVLLELSIMHYAHSNGISFRSSDYFADRVSSVADSMLNRGLIDKKARSIIRKFESDKPIVSAHSMHQYVHNANCHPTRSDMKAIWNVVRPLIMNSVR